MGRESKMEREQEEILRTFLRNQKQPDIDVRRKQQTLEFLRMERRHIHPAVRKPYGKRVLEQAAYLSPVAWLFQGLLAAALACFFWQSERQRLLYELMCCAPLIGTVGFTEILRSYRKDMWELEQACRYNLRQLIGMRLLIFAAADSLVAGGVMLCGFQAGIRAGEILVFFLIPQILSDSLYLYLLARFRQSIQGIALAGTAVLLTLLWLQAGEFLVSNPQVLWRLLEPAALLGAVLLSLGLLALCCLCFLKEVERDYRIGTI